MEPLFFDPIVKRARWGGRKLGELLNKPIGAEQDYAESWEIADQPAADSLVSSGRWRGQNLSALIRQHGPELLGRHAGLTQFPLLIKFLDAQDWLSLQVHPNDQQARQYGSGQNGKTEAWVILQAEPDSTICCGLKPDVTRLQLAEALQAGCFHDLLHIIPVNAGDCVYVPAGTVHALGPGIVMAEVQQQSDLTFRLSDWGRMGSDGQPRELHVQESLDCTDFDRGPVDPVVPAIHNQNGHTCEELVRCDHFVIRRHPTSEPFRLTANDSFRILMLLDGQAQLEFPEGTLPLTAGKTVLIPAALQDLQVVPDGEISVLDVTCP